MAALETDFLLTNITDSDTFKGQMHCKYSQIYENQPVQFIEFMFKIMKRHFRSGLGCVFQIYILTQFSNVQDIKHAYQEVELKKDTAESSW